MKSLFLILFTLLLSCAPVPKTNSKHHNSPYHQYMSATMMGGVGVLDASTDVQLKPIFLVNINQKVDDVHIGQNSIVITDGNKKIHVSDVFYSSSMHRLSFQPVVQLSPNHKYDLSISNQILSDKETYDGTYNIHFETGNSIIPQAYLLGVTSDNVLQVVFNEIMYHVSGNVLLRTDRQSSLNIIPIRLLHIQGHLYSFISSFISGRSYFIEFLHNVVDAHGTHLSASNLKLPKIMNVDSSQLHMYNLFSGLYKQDVQLLPSIVVYFTKIPLVGESVIKIYGDDNTVIGTTMFKLSKHIYTVLPVEKLHSHVLYHFDALSVHDINHHSLSGKSDFYFTTSDKFIPTAIPTSIIDGDTFVSVTPSKESGIQLHFTTPVELNDGVRLYRNSVSESNRVSINMIAKDNQQDYEIVPTTGTFDYLTHYIVVVSDAIMDKEGNKTTPMQFAFTTQARSFQLKKLSNLSSTFSSSFSTTFGAANHLLYLTVKDEPNNVALYDINSGTDSLLTSYVDESSDFLIINHNSIAYSDGNYYITYTYKDNHTNEFFMKVLVWDQTDWQQIGDSKETVDTNLNVNTAPAIIAYQNDIYVLYVSKDYHLKCVELLPDGTEVEILNLLVASDVHNIQMKRDSDNLYIAYSKSNIPYIYLYNISSDKISTIGMGVSTNDMYLGRFNYLINNGNIFISYLDNSTTFIRVRKYANGSWQDLDAQMNVSKVIIPNLSYDGTKNMLCIDYISQLDLNHRLACLIADKWIDIFSLNFINYSSFLRLIFLQKSLYTFSGDVYYLESLY